MRIDGRSVRLFKLVLKILGINIQPSSIPYAYPNSFLLIQITSKGFLWRTGGRGSSQWTSRKAYMVDEMPSLPFLWAKLLEYSKASKYKSMELVDGI